MANALIESDNGIHVDKYSVDDLLDSVNYKFEGYIPSADAFKFFSFMRLVLGEEPENSNSLAHYFLIDVVFRNADPWDYYGIKSDISRDNYIAVLCHREFSKLHSKSTPIMTPSGWTTMGDLKVGDEVINRYGKPTKITHKSDAMRPNMYRMTLTDGSTQDIGEDHLNIVWSESRRPQKGRPEKVMTTKELFDGPALYYEKEEYDKRNNKRYMSKKYKYGIPLVDPIDLPKADLYMDPYILGYGLANANFKSGEISCHADDIEEIAGYYNEAGYDVHSAACPIGTKDARFRCNHTNIYSHYRFIGKSETKFIPSEYQFGSIEQRLSLLRGLMDGDGTTDRAYSYSSQRSIHTYNTVSESLAKDVVELVRSLGGISYIREYQIEGGRVHYNVAVNIKLNPYRLKRKASQWSPTKKILRSIVSLEKIDCVEDGYCINVASKCRSYIAGDGLIVTHNSVILGTMLVLYMAYEGKLPGFGSVNFGGYIGNAMKGGVRDTMRTIKAVYKDSEFLQDKFVRVNFTDTDVLFVRHPRLNADGSVHKQDRNEGKRTFVMSGYGAQAGPRGSRSGLVRPQFFIIDDVIKTAADSRSDVILSNIKSMVTEDVGYALHGARSFCIYIGTPFNLRDPLMNALIDGTWTPVVFPIAEKISIDITEDEFMGSWEDRHSYKSVMTKYKTAVYNGTLPAFMQEQMLRVASDEDKLITDDMINWFSRRDVILNGSNYNWYITTDFTTSGSKGSDFSGIAVWAINNNGDYMLCDLQLKKVEMDEQYEKTLEFVSKYKHHTGWISAGIEVDGQQRAHIHSLKQLMQKHNNYFTIAKQIGKNTEGILRKAVKGNKFDYFQLMVPAFQNGKIWFAEELRETSGMIELLSELSYVVTDGIGSKHDDGLDLISQLSQLKIIVPDSYDKETLSLTYDAKNDIYDVETEEEPHSRSSVIF